MKLKEYSEESDRWLWGKVFILKSEKFGTHTFLVSKYPAKSYQDRHKFIDLESERASAMFYSSVENDEVVKVFEDLKEWACQII